MRNSGVIPLYCSLEQFVSALFSILNALQQERDRLAADSDYKRPANIETNSDLQQYQRSLISYAYPFAKKQEELSECVSMKKNTQGHWQCQSHCGETNHREQLHLPI